MAVQTGLNNIDNKIIHKINHIGINKVKETQNRCVLAFHVYSDWVCP